MSPSESCGEIIGCCQFHAGLQMEWSDEITRQPSSNRICLFTTALSLTYLFIFGRPMAYGVSGPGIRAEPQLEYVVYGICCLWLCSRVPWVKTLFPASSAKCGHVTELWPVMCGEVASLGRMLGPPLCPFPSLQLELRCPHFGPNGQIQYPTDDGAKNQNDCCHRAGSCQAALIALKPGLFYEKEQTSTCLSNS